MPNLDSKILKLLICPKTGSKLFYDKKKKILFTKDGKNKYKIENDILNLFVKWNLNMVPDSVKLSDDKKSLVISYSEGKHLILSSVELRAHSPSAENKKNLEKPDFSKYSNILIQKIDGVGNYAVRIIFNDGHNTGIYSWEYLYEIGTKIQNSAIP